MNRKTVSWLIFHTREILRGDAATTISILGTTRLAKISMRSELTSSNAPGLMRQRYRCCASFSFRNSNTSLPRNELAGEGQRSYAMT